MNVVKAALVKPRSEEISRLAHTSSRKINESSGAFTIQTPWGLGED